MDIIKVIGIALTSVVLIIIIKQYKPEFAVYISLMASALILFIFMDKLAGIVSFLSNFSDKLSRWWRILKNPHQNHRNCDSNGICCAEYVKTQGKMQLDQKSI